MTDFTDIVTGRIATTAGSIDTAADWDIVAGWVDTMVDDMLEVTNNGTGDVVIREIRLIKCCLATAGDVNCLASWVVTFVLHDLSMILLIHTKKHSLQAYLYSSDQFVTVFE